jgi:trans-AT polyketide synthase/acyltransferase/oxidoreductase domain-containing protein
MVLVASADYPPIGWWTSLDSPPEDSRYAVEAALRNVNQTYFVVGAGRHPAVSSSGTAWIGPEGNPPASLRKDALPLRAYLPTLPPRQFGSQGFRRRYGLKYAYVAGAMANGITSVEMVTAMAKAGMIGFFGAAGLNLDRIEDAITRLQTDLGTRPHGFNLIHNPSEPTHEAAVVDLYLRRGVTCVSAAAYVRLSLPLIRYRTKGIHRNPDGRIVCPHRVIAKVSREEVAARFFAPPPDKMLNELVRTGELTREQAALAAQVSVASDLTAEADSGGHTDNRPALSLLPTMLALRDRLVAHHGYQDIIDVGLAGGIATPEATAAAFAMGAAYVLTGSVNQSCIESGTSDLVRQMLAAAQQADVAMAPAADMFEMGVKVQVLKRGTMFPLRAQKLYDTYRLYPHWEAVPAKERAILEREFFRRPFEEEWAQTCVFFEGRDPSQIQRAAKDPRHKMALVFRSYLGQSSSWANSGDPSRQMDYQIWCGPSIGAFNEWIRDSFLEQPANRQTVTVALNFLLGAAVLNRINHLRHQGIQLPPDLQTFRPLPLSQVEACLQLGN